MPSAPAAGSRCLLDSLATLGRLTFFLGSERWRRSDRLRRRAARSVVVPRADDSERAALWRERLGEQGVDAAADGKLDADTLASEFRFTPGQIDDTVETAVDLARWRGRGDGRLERQDLLDAARAQASPELGRLARRLEPRGDWNDLVLPADQLVQLRELCDQARHRATVLGAWGFGRKLSHGKGLAALFSGPPGTGKTLAASILAAELGLDLFKIDLSQVVSKYIGETEKNLDRIFTAAEDSSAILFFDEADALFGKRSEVRDSHDRYANVGSSYLPRRWRSRGDRVLATNLRQHLDEPSCAGCRASSISPSPRLPRPRGASVGELPRQRAASTATSTSRASPARCGSPAAHQEMSLAAAFSAAADGG